MSLEAAEERDRFRAELLEALPDATVVVGRHGAIVAVNGAAGELFGWPPDDLVGQPIEALLPDGVRDGHTALRDEFFARPERRMLAPGHVLHGARRDGTLLPVEVCLSPLEVEEGHVVMASVRDLTMRRQTEEALRASEERFRRIFEDAPIGVGVIDAGDGRILEANRELAVLLGQPDDGNGWTTLDFVDPAHRARTVAAFDELRHGHVPSIRFDIQVVDADGLPRWVRVAGSLVRGAAGEPSEVIVQVEDITARREAEEQLLHMALHDALTGLPNRTLFIEEVRRAQSAAARDGSWVAVLFLDLDGFKAVNDSYGHETGDEILRQVGGRLSGALRPRDTAARLGGDEFVVCCPNLGTNRAAAATAATAIGKRIVRALRGDYAVGEHVGSVDVSVGTALVSGTSEPAESVLRRADAAMYESKQEGGGAVDASVVG